MEKFLYFNITRSYLKFNFGSFSHKIYWYGVLYLVSFLLIRFLIKKDIKKRKIAITPSEINEISETSMIAGIVGGRIWFLIDRWLSEGIPIWYRPYQVWEGGMAFQGGLLLGFTWGMLWVIFKRKKKEIPNLSDIITAHLPLGIMIGRIGNFLNQEFMWPVTVNTVYIPLILFILSFIMFGDFYFLILFICASFSFIPLGFPTFTIPSCLFSSITEGFLAFSILRRLLSRNYNNKFRTTWLFFVVYGTMRFINDLFRKEVTYNIMNLNLKLSQYISILIITVSTVCYSFYYLLYEGKNRNIIRK